MKPAKRQRSKQRCQDLGWKFHGHAQSSALRPYTMHESLTEPTRFYRLLPQYRVNNYRYIVFCSRSRPKKRRKTYNKELCRVL